VWSGGFTTEGISYPWCALVRGVGLVWGCARRRAILSSRFLPSSSVIVRGALTGTGIVVLGRLVEVAVVILGGFVITCVVTPGAPERLPVSILFGIEVGDTWLYGAPIGEWPYLAV
jgi:hypothetical protein